MEGIIDELCSITKMNMCVCVAINLVEYQLPKCFVVINAIVVSLEGGSESGYVLEN